VGGWGGWVGGWCWVNCKISVQFTPVEQSQDPPSVHLSIHPSMRSPIPGKLQHRLPHVLLLPPSVAHGVGAGQCAWGERAGGQANLWVDGWRGGGWFGRQKTGRMHAGEGVKKYANTHTPPNDAPNPNPNRKKMKTSTPLSPLSHSPTHLFNKHPQRQLSGFADLVVTPAIRFVREGGVIAERAAWMDRRTDAWTVSECYF